MARLTKVANTLISADVLISADDLQHSLDGHALDGHSLDTHSLVGLAFDSAPHLTSQIVFTEVQTVIAYRSSLITHHLSLIYSLS